MKKSEILQDIKWANAIGKMAPIGLLNTGLQQTFYLWKLECLLSTIKQDMPV